MSGGLRQILTASIILAMAAPAYAEGEAGSAAPVSPTAEASLLSGSALPQEPLAIHFKKVERYATFSDWINARNYSIHIDRDKEREKVREEWRQALGMDVFSPYFKAEEIKNKVEKKASVKTFKIKGTRIKGKPRIKKDEAKYIFSIKF